MACALDHLRAGLIYLANCLKVCADFFGRVGYSWVLLGSDHDSGSHSLIAPLQTYGGFIGHIG